MFSESQSHWYGPHTPWVIHLLTPVEKESHHKPKFPWAKHNGKLRNLSKEINSESDNLLLGASLSCFQIVIRISSLKNSCYLPLENMVYIFYIISRISLFSQYHPLDGETSKYTMGSLVYWDFSLCTVIWE